MLFKKLSLAFASMALFATGADAQQLEIIAPDTVGVRGMIANHGEFKNIQFTDGKMLYDSEKCKDYTEATIFIMSDLKGFIPVVIEPGQTLSVTLKKKNGEVVPEFKGKNSEACIFLNQADKVLAKGWQTVTYDENDDEHVTLNKDFDFEAEKARVGKAYATAKKLASKVKEPEHRDYYLHYTDANYLYSLISIVKAKEGMAGRNIKDCSEYKELVSRIDPNDSVMSSIGLVSEYIDSKCTHSYRGGDLTAYALERIAVISSNISNEKIAHRFYNELASTIFNSDNTKMDLDAFWTEYTKHADKPLVDHYQVTYNSRKATVSGAPCPDETFMDIDGNKHQLSEFFNKGKYIYIDIWATWCGPCCAEIPYIEKHVEHYKNNDKIQFVSISVDSKIDAWKKKLAKDNPQWPQFVVQNKDEYEKLSKDWGITGIPRFLIINPDGTINNASAFRPSDEQFREKIDAIIAK